MVVSELIARLEEIRSHEGDLSVMLVVSYDCGYGSAIGEVEDFDVVDGELHLGGYDF